MVKNNEAICRNIIGPGVINLDSPMLSGCVESELKRSLDEKI